MKLRQWLTGVFCIAVTSGASAAGELEEIVVTAQKRTQSLQDVPIAVSSFSSEDIRNQGMNATQALQGSTPGLVFNNTGAAAQPFLRGVGTRLAQNGLELSIATYVDDRYVARPSGTMFELADVERIEVLKGPQGTLYGRNSTGGAIRVITKEVGNELGGSFRVSAGNYNAYTVSGSVDVPLSDDFGMRLAVMSKQRDGYAENVNPVGRKEWDDLDYQAYRAKFRWDASDRVTANLTLDYWERDDLAGVENVNVSDFPVTANTLGAAQPTTRKRGKLASAIDLSNEGDEFSAQLKFEVGFDGFDFSSVTTFTDYDMFWLGDADGASIKHLDAFVNEASTTVSQEFQLISNNVGSFNWILGAYFYEDDADYELWIDLDDVGVPMASQSDQNTVAKSSAIFAQAAWDLNESTKLTVGGRFTDDEKEVSAVPSSLPFIVIPAFGAVTPIKFDESWSEFTPSITLDWNVNEDVMLYATYSRGFKSGGFNYPAVVPPKTVANATLEPEILDMFELGMKGEFQDSTLRFNTSLFYYDYQDLQVTRASGGVGAAVTTENAADAKITGLDLDLVWLASDNLTVTAGVNFLNTEYDSYDASGKVPNFAGSGVGGAVIDIGFDASGDDLLRAPDFSGFVSFEYLISMENGKLPIYLNYSYKSEYNFDFILDPLMGDLEQDAYGILTARISYEPNDSNWIVSVYGQNLTDEEYLNDSVANGAGLRVNRGDPRLYGIDFTYNF